MSGKMSDHDRYWYYRSSPSRMAGYPPSYGQQDPGRGYGRDPYAVTSQPGGYYSTYPGQQQGPQQGPPPPKQYDNRGYRDDPRYYDAPPTRAPAPKPYKPELPDAPPAGLNGREWSTGIFDCTKDVKTCMCVWCCSPWYEMYRAHEFGESCWDFSPCCLGTAVSALVLRHRTREREGIRGSLMKDCFAMTFCGLCTICQLYRENDMVRGGGGDMQAGRPMDRY